MTFLIHIDDGRRIDITAIMLRLSGVVHHEIVTHIHATIGGHMRFKATVRHHNAAEHCCGRIVGHGRVENRSNTRLAPIRTIGMKLLHRCIIGSAAHDGDFLSRGEVPHQLLGNLRIGIGIQVSAIWNLIIVAGLATHDVTVGNFFRSRSIRVIIVRSAAPPEAPAGTHLNLIARAIFVHHVDHNGRIFGNITEPKINALISIQLGSLNRKYLKLGFLVSSERNQLFITTVEAHLQLVCAEVLLGRRMISVPMIAGMYIIVVIHGILIPVILLAFVILLRWSIAILDAASILQS